MTTTRRTRKDRVPDPILAAVRARRCERDHAEVGLLRSVLDWAVEHTVTEVGDVAAVVESFGDTALALAGRGAPCVSEFDTYELAAALGMSSDSGKKYVGRALELRFRLPRIYARVIAGDLAVWMAGRIADATIPLPVEGAAYVDRMLAPTAHKSGLAQLDRLVQEALVRFDPDEAERRRKAATEHRRFDVYTEHAGFEGVVEVAGTLDLADALDLDAAITQTASQLGAAGCEESLDVRRSMAAGELARHQLALDLTTPDPSAPDATAPDAAAPGSSAPGPSAPGLRAPDAAAPFVEPFETVAERPPQEPPVETPATGALTRTTGRGVTLYVHLADPTIARYGRQLISVEQVKTWCEAAGTTVKVQPVIDLHDSIQVGAYEIPDRIHQLVRLRDHHCVFPYCTRTARCCDTDHITPYSECQRTDSDDLAPLCRMHHRAKTHSAWDYHALTPGEYAWTSPRGLQFKVDHTGTTALDP